MANTTYFHLFIFVSNRRVTDPAFLLKFICLFDCTVRCLLSVLYHFFIFFHKYDNILCIFPATISLFSFRTCDGSGFWCFFLLENPSLFRGCSQRRLSIRRKEYSSFKYNFPMMMEKKSKRTSYKITFLVCVDISLNVDKRKSWYLIW